MSETSAWKLPLDTVEALWCSAFPAMMHKIWGDFKPKGDLDIQACFDVVRASASDPTAILDDPERLRAWFDCRLARDGVNSLLPLPLPHLPKGEMMLPEGTRVSTWDGLVHTYVVYDGGIVLPRLPQPPYDEGSSPFPDHPDGTPADDTGAADEAGFLRDLYAHIQDVHKRTGGAGFRPSWHVRGTQIDVLRTAASVALMRLWRSTPNFGRGEPDLRPERFCALVLNAYDAFRADDARLPALPPDWLRPEPISMSSADLGTYFNPEDGAGFFAAEGYHLFAPPPPPVYDGLLTPPGDDAWTGSPAFNCGGYAARQAYATPCTCPSARRRFFRRHDEPPITDSAEGPGEAS